MEHRLAPLSARVRACSRRALCLLLLTLVAVVSAACSEAGAASPEELFADIRSHVQQRDWRGVFQLMHEDAQRREMKVIQDAKTFLLRNRVEGNENVYRQFNYSSREEFLRADPMDIWVRHHTMYKPNALDDAKLGDRAHDPQHPSDVVFPWWDAWGGRWMMRARRENGRWLLMDLAAGQP